MHQHIEERCIRIGQYIADTGATVREAARHFGVSKSSVHKDMDERLPRLSTALSGQVRQVLSYNKSVRHLRGGEATRKNTARLSGSADNRDASFAALSTAVKQDLPPPWRICWFRGGKRFLLIARKSGGKKG